MSQTSTVVASRPSARLGANHGYVIEGDLAQLHADVELLEQPSRAGRWALQLWACDAPHTGGPLAGVKIAEAALTDDLDLDGQARRLGAEALARVPGGQRDYAMVLVLASGDGGHYTQVHDFANYPARQRFVTPHLEGSVGYRVDDEHVVIDAGAIHSPRAADNLSGSLRLELWALAGPYRGGSFEGHAMGYIDLGRLPGQCTLHEVSERVPFTPPPTGHWDVTLMLREWAGPAGYVTRDYATFAVRYVVAEVPSRVESAVPSPDREVEVVSSLGGDTASSLEANAAASEAPPDADAAAERAASAPAARQPAGVSINTASVDALAEIKGMSRKVAAEIVKGRPYDSVDALVGVRGIGPRLLDRLRAFLTI